MAHLYLRGKTYWVAYRKDGKTVYESLKTRDKTLANYKKYQTEISLRNGEYHFLQKDILLQKVFEEYLKYCHNRLLPRTVLCYKCFLEPFFKWLNRPFINQITDKAFQEYLHQRFENGKIQARTANHTIKYLKAFLDYAVKQKYLLSNPVKSFKLYKIDIHPPRFLSSNEVKRVLEASKGESLEGLIYTAIYTGMRLGELARLTWQDIDLENNKIVVMKSKSRKFRIIPLHPMLKKYYLSCKDRTGKCFNIVNFRRVFKRIKRKAKLSDIGCHCFRHTFASHLAMAGENIITIKELLGHADVTTTQIYSHLTDHHIYKSVKRLRYF